nr:bifunctional oligoribonuclease/PAP phosphatase NrnA [Clostridia bacterium]
GETDSVVVAMRAIRGVEVVAFLKEKDRNVIRVSYRAKSFADVSKLAVSHNGGGHRKAAGCTLYMPIHDAVALVIRENGEYLDESVK